MRAREITLYRHTERAERFAARYAPRFEKEIRAATDRHSIAALLMRAAGRAARLQKGILQFVSILPTLKTIREVHTHYRQFILPHVGALPVVLRFGAKLAAFPLARAIGMRAVLWAIKKKIAPHFIIPDKTAFLRAQKLYGDMGAKTNVDFLGEDSLSWAEADEYLDFYTKAMRQYGGKAEPFNVSVKFSALYPFFTPENSEESRRVGVERFSELLRVAKETNTCIAVDAEQYGRQRIIEDIFFDALMLPDFRRMENVKIATQACLTRGLPTARKLVAFAKERSAPFFIRLVKGAYVETERAIAAQRGWPSPVWDTKQETDKNFNRELAFLMGHWGTVFVSPATHNPTTVLFAQALARRFKIANDPRFTFEALHGLGEPMIRVLTKKGWRVLVYLPLLKKSGDLLQGMGYFARRLEENTAGDNVLRMLLM